MEIVPLSASSFLVRMSLGFLQLRRIGNLYITISAVSQASSNAASDFMSVTFWPFVSPEHAVSSHLK